MKIKGWELMKKIADGEIKEGSRLKFTNQQNGANITVTVGKDCSGNFVLENENTNNSLYANWLFNTDIELIQDEIDIADIQRLDEWITRRNGEVTQKEGKILEIGNKVNELVQAVKQLNKKLEVK